MTSKSLVGICEEPTTYRDEFRSHVILPKAKENRYCKKLTNSTRKIPFYIESHDTLQKLDYSNRLPFNALWRCKDIVGTNPRAPFFKKTSPEERPRVLRKEPIELASPAVNLDDPKNPEMRNLVVDFMYKTTASRGADEVWRNFKKPDVQLPNTICGDSTNPVSLRLKLISDLPAGFKGAAKKWDSLQDRNFIEPKNLCQIWDENNILGQSKDLEVKEALTLDGKKLRLPYEKLPLSYGGHRTSLAIGVNLEKKDLPIYHPDLSVSQLLALRRCQDS